MQNNKFQIFIKIIFFGALWGALEASLGYVLHFIPGYLSGSVMFPIVLFILYRAYKSLGTKKAIVWVAFVAIGIKSLNLLLPFMPPAKTINPMIAMFLEAGLVFAVIPLISSNKLSSKFSGVLVAGLVWRVLYVGYQGINYLVTGFLSNYLKSFSMSFEFVIIYGLIGSFLAILVLLLTEKKIVIQKLDRLRINPMVSFGLLMLAIILTLSL